MMSPGETSHQCITHTSYSSVMRHDHHHERDHDHDHGRAMTMAVAVTMTMTITVLVPAGDSQPTTDWAGFRSAEVLAVRCRMWQGVWG
jgi:hypothetical protein